MADWIEKLTLQIWKKNDYAITKLKQDKKMLSHHVFVAFNPCIELKLSPRKTAAFINYSANMQIIACTVRSQHMYVRVTIVTCH